MSERPERVVLFFVDGFGWGETDSRVNPQHAAGNGLLRLPQRPPAGTVVEMPRGGLSVPLDALLGVGGVPQSATGQTSLLTGRNAQQLLGKHLTGFPNEALRDVLLEDSVLKRVAERGRRPAFINTFRPVFFEMPRQAQLRLSATTVATLASGVRFFDFDDLLADRSIYQDMTHADLRHRGFDVPLRTPAEAGRILGRRAADFDFVLYEYFQSDRAGHAADLDRGCRQIELLEEFLDAALDTLPADALLLLSSDHGNLEDASTKRHTTNPVPLIAWGPGAADFVTGPTSLTDIVPAILELLPPV